MRIAKPMLMVSTPLGIALGLYEGWRLTGGLVVLMALMMGVVSAGVASVVGIARAERRTLAQRQEAACRRS